MGRGRSVFSKIRMKFACACSARKSSKICLPRERFVRRSEYVRPKRRLRRFALGRKPPKRASLVPAGE